MFIMPKKSKELFNWLQMRCQKQKDFNCIEDRTVDCKSCRYASYSRPEWNKD